MCYAIKLSKKILIEMCVIRFKKVMIAFISTYGYTSHLGLVWLHAFPRGSSTFPEPNNPRAELTRMSPPDRLDAIQPTIPRRFRVQPGEPVLPLVRRGTESARQLALGVDSGATAPEPKPLPSHPHTTGKKGIAVQPIIAVRRCTAKTSLMCAASSTHDKDKPHGKV
jgi:hypothetical protein